MRWAVHHLADYPGDLWSDWERLALCHHGDNPMLDACFVRLLVAHFGKNVELHVLTGYVDGRVDTLALVEQLGFGWWCIFTPSQAQAALLVSSPALTVDIARMLAAFPRFCVRLDVLALDPREHQPFLSGSPLIDCKLAARNICVDTSGGFECYWEHRPRNLKKNMRRYRNRASGELGPLRCEVFSTPSDVSSAIDRYGLLESSGWKGREGTALHPNNSQGEFYRALMVEMAERSRAYVFELYATGSLVASRFCLTGGGMLVILKTTFDENFKRYAVGRLLLYEVLQYIFGNELAKVVDFYTNATDDQREWATSSRSMVHCSIYSSTKAKWIFKGFEHGRRLIHASLRK